MESVLYKKSKIVPKQMKFESAVLNPNLNQIDPPCGFLKNVSTIERVELLLFVIFNNILKHMFPEKFIEFPQVLQKI